MVINRVRVLGSGPHTPTKFSWEYPPPGGGMKSHTNEHTVRGRPTLKDFKHFRKGSVCQAYESSLRGNILSKFIKNLMLYQMSYQLRLHTFQRDKKHLRSVIVFSDVIVNQVGAQHQLITSEQQEQKGYRENLFLLFTNTQCLFVQHPYGDLNLLFVRESEDFIGFLCNC